MRALLLAMSFSTVCFLAAGCGAGDQKKDERPKDGADQKDDPMIPDNRPTFETTSKEPVILRYKLKTGQKLNIVLIADTEMSIRLSGEGNKVKAKTTLETRASVRDVDAQGNMSLDVQITRLALKIDGLPQGAGFDTDKLDDADPKSRSMKAMLRASAVCKLSPAGKLLEIDATPLLRAARDAGREANGKLFESVLPKLFNLLLVQLSEKPVRTGETFKSGILSDEPWKVQMAYKLASVSGDKCQAILEPIGEQELLPGAFPGMDATIKTQQLTGWMLFDIQKGYPREVNVSMRAVVALKSQGKKGTMETDTKARVTTILE